MLVSKVLYDEFFLIIGTKSLNEDDNNVEIEDTLFNKDIFIIINQYIFHEIILKKIYEYISLNELFFKNVIKMDELKFKANKTNILLFPLSLFYKKCIDKLDYENVLLEIAMLKLVIGERRKN